MSLSLTANFIHKQNLVLPLAQSSAKTGLAIRVASGGSGQLGTLQVSGATETPTWSIAQNPSWLTISPSADGLTLTINFVNASAQGYPYQFYVTVTDGVSTTYFPVFLEVKDPLRLALASTGSTTISVASYDSSVSDQIIEGLGANSIIDSGVNFVLPSALPAGLNFVTSDLSKLILRVNDSTAADIAGGLKLYTSSPVTTQLNIAAYKSGTMYDNPSRAVIQPFTIESLSAKAGTPDVALAVQELSNGSFQLNASVDFLGGQTPSGVTYQWWIAGTAPGTISAGGGNSLAMTWTPAGTGVVNFTFRVLSSTGVILAQTLTPNINCSVSPTWTATNAIKLILSQSTTQGAAGTSQSVTISTPSAEFNAGETITISLSVVGASAIEATANTTVATVSLTTGSPSATITLPIPNSSVHQKWVVQASAANAVSSPTRTGYAQAVFISTGLPSMVVGTASGTSLTSNIGQSINPLGLTATFNSSPVTGVTYSLLGAPDGLSISGGALVGNVLQPGTYTFKIIAEAAGYTRSYSSVITLVAAAFTTPLTITDAVATPTSLPDGQQFQVGWGVTGTATQLTFIQNFTRKSVLGANSTQAIQSGNSVIAVYGESFYGDAYSIPALILSSSIVAAGTLLNAPTIGVIDENHELTLNWNPLAVNGTYEVYKGFNIWLTALPNGSPVLQLIGGAIPTGLEVSGATQSARGFASQLSSGDYQVSMQALSNNASIAQNSAPWDNAHGFPTALSPASISFDHQTVDMGQVVNISIDPNYTGSDTWCVFYPDGTTSGWLPLSVKTVAKAFNTAGTTPIVVQTERDYSTANPGVRLRRQVTLSIYVMDQEYQSVNTSDELTGSLGFGGDAGFEITDATSNAVALSPYLVLMRALVRDTMTNELKLMVASARTADASSLLGTMAIDVFPIVGRPRTLERIDPALYLSAEMVQPGSPVRIATSTLPTAIVGKPYAEFQLQAATGTGVAPLSWYADALPFGMKLSINGVLSGTPTAIGTYTINVSVVDSNKPAFISNTTLTLTVESDLTIPVMTLPVGQVGTNYEVQVVATGGIPPLNWEIASGEPPVGISIDPDTGILNGTPVTYNSTTDFSKTFNFTVQATDSIGAVASTALAMQISPAALNFGNLDQPEVFAAQQFRLIVPVVGGKAPYSMVKFTDDGTMGSGVSVANPQEIDVPAGVAAPSLALTVSNQSFYPQSLPADPAIVLSATGGQPPYNFSIPGNRSYAKPALTGATVYGDLLLSTPDVSESYSIEIEVTDQRGKTASQLLNVDVFQKGWNGYTIKPVKVTTNGSTNPANFTFQTLSGLPDGQNGQPYNGGSNIYYGLALYNGNAQHLTQTSGGDGTPMNFTVRSGSLPSGIVTFSANSFGQTTDYSGLILFNVSGGSNPSTNGSWSFEGEFSNIRGTGGAILPVVVSRASITITTSGGGATPVVTVTTTADYNLDLARVSGTPYAWYYPLSAEGGTGPYTFHLQSGTTLPGAELTNVAAMFASSGLSGSAPTNAICFSSTSATPGTYVVKVAATDANGVQSATVTINVNVSRSPTEPIHIISQNLPAYLYQGQAIAPNTYFLESDLAAAWAAANLPAGVSLIVTGNKAYLSGTPTSSGPASVTFTASSTAFSTTAAVTVNLPVQARSAIFVSKPTSAIVGISYRASNNNALLFVQYTGYQPGDPTLPLVYSQNGTVGGPGVSNSGTPTVAILNLTSDGFTMAYDYTCPTVGNDVVLIRDTNNTTLDLFTLPVSYSPLVVTGINIPVTVSEYSTSSLAASPVSVSGGLAPYTYAAVGFSDPRFTASSGQVSFNPAQFNPGQTYTVSVSVNVTDSSGQTSSAVGTLTVTVRAENYVRANFTPGTLNLPLNLSGSPAGLVETYIPIANMVQPILGHAPFQLYTDQVSFAPPQGTVPGSPLALAYTALQQLLQVSPSQNVLFVCYGAAASGGTGGSIYDETASLTVGTLIGTAQSLTTTASLPTAGTYYLAITLRVVDADGFQTSQTVTLTVVVTD